MKIFQIFILDTNDLGCRVRVSFPGRPLLLTMERKKGVDLFYLWDEEGGGFEPVVATGLVYGELFRRYLGKGLDS